MHWIVHSTLVCPYTGTAFSSILTLKNLKLILWYYPEVLLKVSDIIEPVQKGVMVNGKYYFFTIYKVFHYNQILWETLKSGLNCPGNITAKSKCCDFPDTCSFMNCPWSMTKRGKP